MDVGDLARWLEEKDRQYDEDDLRERVARLVREELEKLSNPPPPPSAPDDETDDPEAPHTGQYL